MDLQWDLTLGGAIYDSLAAERAWTGPFFLKFDTRSVELDILAGAERILMRTNLVMMEVYNFRLNFVQGQEPAVPRDLPVAVSTK